MSIDVAHLSFSYGSREILHDLSFSIPDGCLVNVLGPNGVGKSTLAVGLGRALAQRGRRMAEHLLEGMRG